MIIIVTIAAMTGIVPNATKAAAKRLQSFMSSCLVLIIMVGVGADTDLNQLIDAINLSNVVIAFLIVVGAIIGSAIVGQLVGFYPIDSAITAGLCMATAAVPATLLYWVLPIVWASSPMPSCPAVWAAVSS